MNICIHYLIISDIRLDKWLERSIEITDGTFKSLISVVREAEKNKKKEATTNIKSQDDTLYQENWMGQNLELRDESIKTLVRVKRSQTTILEPEGTPSSLRVPQLKNDATSTGTKSRPTIITTNTCAFDALTQTMFHIYGNQVHLSNEFSSATDEFSKFIQYCFSSGAQERQVYLKRNQLLMNLFPDCKLWLCAYLQCGV